MLIVIVKKVCVSVSRGLTLATTDVHIKLKSRASARETGFAKLSS